MKNFFHSILFGDITVSEYSTVTVPGAITESVFIETNGNRWDISANQFLLCLKPAIFGIWIAKEGNSPPVDDNQDYNMYFIDSKKNNHTVAVIRLVFFNKLEEQDGTLLLLKLAKTNIHHIGLLQERLLFYRHYKKPGQDWQTVKSFAAAYSYPRRVRLISFREGEYYNIFPMDLVGDISSEQRYVFGLRHSNASLARILESKKLVVTEIPYQYKDTVYQLGKHHASPLSATAPPFDLLQTERYGFPIPGWACAYTEIQIVSNMNLGSHMLLWGKIINKHTLSTGSAGHLFHIHFLHYLHQKRKGLAYPLV